MLLMLALLCEGCICGKSKSSSPENNSAEFATPIPPSPDAAVTRLRVLLAPARIDELAAQPESKIGAHQLDLRIGIVNYWLVEGSSLRLYFNQRGVYDREDMAEIVIVSLWRSLHGLPAKVEEQIVQYNITHPDEK